MNMKKKLYELQAKFLMWFGNIKLFKWPMFIVYDPSTFKIPGWQILDILQILQPGDVILRGFDAYADGKFIPGDYSHGAVYIGEDNKIIHAVAKGVSEIDAVSFCMCDRICILRPRCGVKNAIAKAKKFAENHVPYDFAYKRNASALYCFELCAECYPKLKIQTKTAKTFFGLLKKKNVYLAESFLESPDFTKVFESNPKRKVLEDSLAAKRGFTCN